MMVFGNSYPALLDDHLRIVLVMWRREMKRYFKDKSQIFGAFSRTVLWLIILGFGLGATLREIEGYTYSQYILPGVMVLNVLFASLQSAFGIVKDRKLGLLRQVMVSPATSLSVTVGKLIAGASVAVCQGLVPLLFVPLIGLELGFDDFIVTVIVLFSMGLGLTGVGVLIATRMSGFESFGAISNGVIQPLYFLSGSIFPLKGIVGGIGFLDIPLALRDELRTYGIYAIGGGWLVELPTWLEAIVRANPISYQLDLLRNAILGFYQLPQILGIFVCVVFPLVSIVIATRAIEKIRQT